MVSRTAMMGGYAFLVVLVVSTVLAAAGNESQPSSNNEKTTLAIKDVCRDTSNQENCVNSITNAINDAKTAINLLNNSAQDPKTAEAYGYCKKFLDDCLYDLQTTLDRMDSFDGKNVKQFVGDIANGLTGSSTYYQDCLDNSGPGQTNEKVSELIKEPKELTTNSLAMVTEFSSFFKTDQTST